MRKKHLPFPAVFDYVKNKKKKAPNILQFKSVEFLFFGEGRAPFNKKKTALIKIIKRWKAFKVLTPPKRFQTFFF